MEKVIKKEEVKQIAIKTQKKPEILFEDTLIEKSKKISVKEACAYSFMDGFGLRYVTPYALAVGANNSQIGLLSSLPSLFGTLSQLLTLKAMRIWTRKKITFIAVLMQAIMWLVLLSAGFIYFTIGNKTSLAPYLVILIYTLLILFGAFGGPAWSSWMKDLVKKNIGNYFGKRARIAGLVALICMIIGGFILDYFKKTNIFIGFIILFSIAFLGRLTSSLLTLKQYESEFKEEKGAYFTLRQFIKKMMYNNFGRFVLYFALISLATAIASPFFTVYMLKNLGFSYSFYMTTVLSSSVFTLLFMPLWGRFADKYGNLKVMKLTGAFVPLIPFLWLATTLLIPYGKTVLLWSIIIIEALSGLAWAGFNLCAGNFIYDAVSRQRMAICVSYFNIINGFGVLIGALLGGFVSSREFTILGLNSLYFVFILSGIARFSVYWLMNNKINEVRKVKDFDLKAHLGQIKEKFGIGRSLKKFFEGLDSTLGQSE